MPSGAFRRGGHWLLRPTLAAACAASAWDAASTRTAIGRRAREANGFLADAAGNPRWGRITGFNVAACAGSLVSEEVFFRRRREDRLWTGLDTGLAAYYSIAAVHDRTVARALPPAAPAAVVPRRPGSAPYSPIFSSLR